MEQGTTLRQPKITIIIEILNKEQQVFKEKTLINTVITFVAN